MIAAELDRLIVAENAFKAAMGAGKSEDEAVEAAKQAVARKNAEQTLRGIGIHGEELETALTNMGY